MDGFRPNPQLRALKIVSIVVLTIIGTFAGGITAIVICRHWVATSDLAILRAFVIGCVIGGAIGGVGGTLTLTALINLLRLYLAAHPLSDNDFAVVNGWPRFSLRAIFFGVAILCLVFAVGRPLYWKQQRERELSSYRGRDRNAAIIEYLSGGGVEPPLALWLLGDDGVCNMLLNERVSDAELARMRRLFPEAEIYRPQDIPTDPSLSYWASTLQWLEAGDPPGTGYWKYENHQWTKLPDPASETDSPDEQSPPEP